MRDWSRVQEELCRKYGVAPFPCEYGEKVGIARNVRSGLLPLNGVRCLPESGTTGWYVWAGDEMSSADDFFVPVHAVHLEEWCVAAMPFLQLPPGWRFLVAGDYVDVWIDPEVDLSPTGGGGTST
jgi:hypothetical protein